MKIFPRTLKYCYWVASFRYITSYWYIVLDWSISQPDAEAIYKYTSGTEVSNVNKTDIVNSIDELVKQNIVVNKKSNSGYDSFFPYNYNPVSTIPPMKLASKSTTPIITPKLTNSPVTPNATLTGSNKNTNIETLSSCLSCNCRSAILNISSRLYYILRVKAQLSALESYVNC